MKLWWQTSWKMKRGEKGAADKSTPRLFGLFMATQNGCSSFIMEASALLCSTILCSGISMQLRIPFKLVLNEISGLETSILEELSFHGASITIHHHPPRHISSFPLKVKSPKTRSDFRLKLNQRVVSRPWCALCILRRIILSERS